MSKKITNGSYTIYYGAGRGLVDVDKDGYISIVAQNPDKLGEFARYDLGHISNKSDKLRLATEEDIEAFGCIYLDDTLHRPLMTKNCQTCPDRYICLLSEVEYPYLREYSKYDYSNYKDVSPEEKDAILDDKIAEIREKLASLGLLEEIESMIWVNNERVAFATRSLF